MSAYLVEPQTSRLHSAPTDVFGPFVGTDHAGTFIKLLLLDQRIVAGLGNIYVCEALHRAGIHPRKAGGRVYRPALEKLVPAIKQVLEQSIRDGGSTLRDYARPDGELGYFSTRFDVYGRTGESCRREDGGPARRSASELGG